jgi:release factor glutamine methyltransferase
MQETLTNFLKNKPKFISILDLGSGSGIQAKTCKNLEFKNITTADINPEATSYLKKQNLNPIHSNLFSNIKDNFDLIIFNPPYLPEDKREPKESQLQTTAGKKGYELIIKFLSQSINHLKKDGTILLLFSSLSKPKIILKHTKNLNLKNKLLNKTKLPFEELYIYEFQKI